MSNTLSSRLGDEVLECEQVSAYLRGDTVVVELIVLHLTNHFKLHLEGLVFLVFNEDLIGVLFHIVLTCR